MNAHFARVHTRAGADRTKATRLNRKDDCLEDRRVFFIERTVDEDISLVLGIQLRLTSNLILRGANRLDHIANSLFSQSALLAREKNVWPVENR